MRGTPTPQWVTTPYHALARAVLLQAVKDVARQVMGADGKIQYHDRGERTQNADAARTFLSTPNAGLTFWCLWLRLHPETIIGAARRMS